MSSHKPLGSRDFDIFGGFQKLLFFGGSVCHFHKIFPQKQIGIWQQN